MFMASLFSTGFLLAALVKGILLTLAATLMYGCLSKAPAAFKHLFLLGTLLSLLSLPLLAVVLPPLPLRVLPAAAIPVQAPAAFSERTPPPLLPLPGLSVASTSSKAVSGMTAEAPRPGSAFRIPVLPALYALGLVLALLSTLVGIVGVFRLRRRASRLECPEWTADLMAAMTQLRLGGRVDLLQSSDLQVPVTWRFRNHAILLPTEAAAWSQERRRIVLLHELAHACRQDFLSYLLGRIAVALHWANPFAWYLLHRMTVERERACDDVVLRAGVVPSEYAQHLLDIVRGLRRRQLLPLPAIAMAHTSRMEGRVSALVDARRRRGTPSAWVSVLCFVTCALFSTLLSSTVLHADDTSPAVTATVGASPNAVNVSLLSLTGTKMEGSRSGHPVTTPLDGGGAIQLSADRTHHFYRVEILVDGAANPVDLRYKFRPAEGKEDFRAMGSSGSGERDHMTFQLDFRLPPDTTAGQLLIGMANGPWEKLLIGRIGGSGSSGSEGGNAAYTCSESEESYTVVVSDTFTGTFTDQLPRLISSDAEGREVIAERVGGGLTGNLRQTEFRFPKQQLIPGTVFNFETSPLSWTELPPITLHLGKTEYAALPAQQGDRRNALKFLGVALKRYSSDQPGAWFPPSTGPGRQFKLDTEPLASYLDEATRTLLDKDPPVYLGHLVTTPHGLTRLLTAYADLGPEIVMNSNISWPPNRRGLGGYCPPLQRLREGVERFLITDINNPAASMMAQSSAPVAWFLPKPDEESIPVLFMDGHVAMVKHDTFPFIDIATEALRNAPAVPADLEGDGSVSWTVQRIGENPEARRGVEISPPNQVSTPPKSASPSAEESAGKHSEF